MIMSGEQGAMHTSGDATPSRSISLNLDIMHTVLSYLPFADLLSASCTVRAVREIAIRELLSRPLVFGEPRRFQSWCNFVLAEPKRLSYVRDLALFFDQEDWEEPEWEEEEDSDLEDTEARLDKQEEISRKRGNLLSEVLRRATRLEKLSIYWVQAVLYAVSAIPLAISRLPALKSFEVEPYSVESQDAVTDILARMKSPLKFLSLQYVTTPNPEDSEEGMWEYDLPRALAPHLKHLQELHLGSPYGRTPNIRSTTLRTLQIPIGEDQPRPRELFEAFPNLRNLIMPHDRTSNDPLLQVQEDRYGVLRDSRISEQSGGHVWSSLDTIQVRRLEIQEYTPDEFDAVVELVEYSTPQKLVISSYITGTEDYREMADEPSLLIPEAPDRPHVTHLTLSIAYPVKDTETLVDDLAPLLRTSKIEYLRLAIGGLDIHEGYLEVRVNNMDLNTLRDNLFDTVKSLRMLAFTTIDYGAVVWTVDRSGESLKISKIDTMILRELIWHEEA